MILGATGRIGRALRVLWPEAWPVTWVGRSEGPLRCDPLEKPEDFAQISRNADIILSVGGAAPGGTLKKAADLADHARLAVALSDIAGERPLLLASSAAVYGNLGAAGVPLTEDASLPDDLAPYGAAKRDMETAAPSATSLRIGNIAGLDAILGGWKEGFELDVFEDGTTPRRSYIGPATLALVLAALCQKAHSLPFALNIAEPGSVAMADLLTAAGLPFARRTAPQSAIREVNLDVTRLQDLIPGLYRPVSADLLVAEAKWLESAQIPT
ncbi:MAG: NAD-dependent epimerase [Rhodobacteraceae bacterium]|nr:NAD-dependent epimerase [Paracoccaceae bacterium]